MATEAALKALSNSQLASGAEIPASKHRTVNDAIIEELFNAQSRGNVLSGVQSALAIAAGDKVLVIRSGQAYLLDADEFGFIDTLAGLSDVNIPTPANDQVLVYDFGTSKWVAKDIGDITTGGDIGGSGTINTIPKFTAGTTIGDSSITDDGTNVSVSGGLKTSNGSLTVDGAVSQIILQADSVTRGSVYANQINQVGFLDGQGNWAYRHSLDTSHEFLINDVIYATINTSGINLALGSFSGNGSGLSNVITTHSVADLGTNQTAVDASSAVALRIRAGLYNASTTLTFSNVTNLFDFTMQITNTNANVLTFAGITVYFKSDDLPTGVTFASNALTFPADSAVKYNIVGVKFDGATFDCKIEIR